MDSINFKMEVSFKDGTRYSGSANDLKAAKKIVDKLLSYEEEIEDKDEEVER